MAVQWLTRSNCLRQLTRAMAATRKTRGKRQAPRGRRRRLTKAAEGKGRLRKGVEDKERSSMRKIKEDRGRAWRFEKALGACAGTGTDEDGRKVKTGFQEHRKAQEDSSARLEQLSKLWQDGEGSG